MNQFFEAAKIALGAIWSNKLRSFLTVLGNIVAVTSIIAVVSLVQGMNGYVTTAILSGVGAENFRIGGEGDGRAALVGGGADFLELRGGEALGEGLAVEQFVAGDLDDGFGR